MRVLAVILAALLAPALAFAQTGLPSLLAAAIAQTIAAQAPYAYEVTVESQRGALHYAFDPAQRGPARVRMIAPAESALDDRGRRTLQRVREDADGDIWCASAKLRQSRNLAIAREDAQTITYSFTPSPEQAGGPQSAAFVRYLRGEATVQRDTPDVTLIRISAAQPFHASIARVDSFNMTIRCEPGPNGRRFAAETVTEISGSALTQRFNERSVQRVHHLAARG